MKLNTKRPLFWTHNNQRHMANFTSLGNGYVMCQSTTNGTEYLKKEDAEAFADLIIFNGGEYLKPKRKLTAKQINNVLSNHVC